MLHFDVCEQPCACATQYVLTQTSSTSLPVYVLCMPMIHNTKACIYTFPFGRNQPPPCREWLDLHKDQRMQGTGTPVRTHGVKRAGTGPPVHTHRRVVCAEASSNQGGAGLTSARQWVAGAFGAVIARVADDWHASSANGAVEPRQAGRA